MPPDHDRGPASRSNEDRGSASLRPPAADRGPASRGLLRQVYDLLSDTSFAIVVLIVLAVASILGVIIVDQIPFRGEFARQHFAGRENDLSIWILTHIVPASPFRSLLFRTLLALLSLSLLACTIKRWRNHWRRAVTIPAPSDAAFDHPHALHWNSRWPANAGGTSAAAGVIADHLRRRLFTVRRKTSAESGGEMLCAVRFGISEFGPVLTHLGMLVIVIGGIVMASAGSSRLVWLRPGEEIAVPDAGFRVTLDDFRVETAPGGQIADYISSVTLWEHERPLRAAEIEVNHPLRFKGYSFYQNAYRRDPTRGRSIDLLFDAVAMEELSFAVRHGGHPAAAGGHQQIPAQLQVPITMTVPWDSTVRIPDTFLSVAIDTFLADFKMGEDMRPALGSEEFDNPAVRLRVFAGDSLAGRSWYFMLHPEMPVGAGLVLPLRFVDVHPLWMTGLEVSTHPGSPFIWAGIALMSLGTVLAFLLRREQIQVRLRERPGGSEPQGGATRESRPASWSVSVLHLDSPRQPPEFVRETWEKNATPLTVSLVHFMEPEGEAPVRSLRPGGGDKSPPAGRSA
ncbi:MAG: cytochrome c biogenesis protein ResB [Candidatus Eisenbacteria bacterium]